MLSHLQMLECCGPSSTILSGLTLIEMQHWIAVTDLVAFWPLQKVQRLQRKPIQGRMRRPDQLLHLTSKPSMGCEG